MSLPEGCPICMADVIAAGLCRAGRVCDDCLDDASTNIVELERSLPSDHPAWWALAHARKEYGHACGTPAGSEAMVYHLGIVARDLLTIKQMLAEGGPNA